MDGWKLFNKAICQTTPQNNPRPQSCYFKLQYLGFIENLLRTYKRSLNLYNRPEHILRSNWEVCNTHDDALGRSTHCQTNAKKSFFSYLFPIALGTRDVGFETLHLRISEIRTTEFSSQFCPLQPGTGHLLRSSKHQTPQGLVLLMPRSTSFGTLIKYRGSRLACKVGIPWRIAKNMKNSTHHSTNPSSNNLVTDSDKQILPDRNKKHSSILEPGKKHVSKPYPHFQKIHQSTNKPRPAF